MKYWNIRLLLVENHPVTAEGLKRILADMPEIREIGTTTDAASALERLRGELWDVLLLDVALPDHGAASLVRSVRAEFPRLPILAIGRHDYEEDARRAVQAGASGCLPPDAGSDELFAALRKVARGGRDPVARKAARRPEAPGATDPHQSLSNREHQVLCLIATGRSPTEIATTIGLSVRTVETYRERVLDKLALGSTPELMRYAVRHELVP